jgi:hypothetical protein
MEPVEYASPAGLVPALWKMGVALLPDWCFETIGVPNSCHAKFFQQNCGGPDI